MGPEQYAYIQHFVGFRPYKLQGLSLEASHRQYYRLSYKTELGAPLSFVVGVDKHLQAHTPNNQHNLPFVYWQKILRQAGLHVPNIVAIEASLNLILLEDLGSTQLSQQPTLENYYKAIEQLVGLQNLKLSTARIEACHPAFTEEFFFNELRFAFEHFVQRHCRTQAQANTSSSFNFSPSAIKALFDELNQLCKHLAQQSQILCHRDFHSRNLMCHKTQVYMIDFQDARLGPPQYDIVSLLYDAYSPLTDNTRNKLLSYYKSLVAEQSATKTQPYIVSPQFDNHLNLQILQRVFKACGSFASFYNLKDDTRYLKYLHSCTHLLYQTAKKTEFNQLKALFQQLYEWAQQKEFTNDHVSPYNRHNKDNRHNKGAL